MRRTTRHLIAAALVAATAALAAGCGGDEPEPAPAPAAPAPAESAGGGSLTVYSGREEEIVEPLIEQFEQATGIDVDVRYGDSAELAATLAEEGGSSPADVFFAQDAGSLGAVAGQGLLAVLPQSTLDRVDARFRDPDGRWVGTSGRVRVIAYNTDEVAEADLPASIFDLTDPAWKGKVGIAPTNASFQAFVSALRLSAGEDQARDWLEGLKANEPRTYEGNGAILEALATGEVALGLVNHYYLYLLKDEQPDAPVANHYLGGGDPGALVNAAGVGIVTSGPHGAEAQQFVDYLLSDEGQQYYAAGAEEAEYPLVAGIAAREGLPALDSLQGPEISLGALGVELERTLELLAELGFTS